jgi:hypothetical protein
MTASNYFENMYLAWWVNTAFASAPTTLYFSLHDGDPSETGTANDITSSTLSGRAAYTSSDFSAPATVGNNRQITSTATCDFGTSTDSGSASYFGIWDASTSGNFLGYGLIQNSLGVATPLTYGSGDPVAIASGGVVIPISITNISLFLADGILNWFKGTTFFSGSGLANSYLGLCTLVNPDGTVTEITPTVSSGREAIAAAGWTSPANFGNARQIKNTNAIDFGSAIAGANGWQFIALWDASTSGNLLAFASLSGSRDIVAGSLIFLAAQSLTLRFD